MLIYLNLARCQLRQIGIITLPNVRTLDLSFNHFVSVDADDLRRFPRLTSLSLAENPFISLFGGENHSTTGTFSAILTLDLSFVEIGELDPSVLRIFPNLQSLNLSHCHVRRVQGSFQFLKSLRSLDARMCPLTSFPKSIFRGLGSLRSVLADNYKVCCPATLPVGFVVDQCVAPRDEISSCDALLRSHFYHISLAVFATLATVGNVLSFFVRVFVLKSKRKYGYPVFVAHLCVSDFLMGVYLVIIGGADRVYMNTYLWKDASWRGSVTCKMAGFLSLLACEVSASIICLVTVDRFLVVRFPFSRLRFQRHNSMAVLPCAMDHGHSDGRCSFAACRI